MTDEKLERAILLDDGTILQAMPDGSFVPMHSLTNPAKLARITDQTIAQAVADDPDAPPLPDEHDLERGCQPDYSAETRLLLLDVDRDVVEYFEKDAANNVQETINAILRDFVERDRRKRV